MATIWTIGYERLLPPQLVAELGAAAVERVIDVRYRPQSRRLVGPLVTFHPKSALSLSSATH